jgi:hypothetical protein
MGSRRIEHCPIVNYTGTLTEMHGLWHVECSGERYTLRSAYGLSLYRVRPSSVRLVEVPRLTPARAEALRRLAATGPAGIPTRARTWLTDQGLAHVDMERGRLCVTALGFELAAAIYRWSY